MFFFSFVMQVSSKIKKCTTSFAVNVNYIKFYYYEAYPVFDAKRPLVARQNSHTKCISATYAGVVVLNACYEKYTKTV